MESEPKGTVNDRIIYAWLEYAGRYDEKTMDQHLLAIRYMEDILDKTSFTGLSKSDIARVRDDLKRRVLAPHDDAWSKSTIKHRASHIKAFLDWLLRQDGYKRLPAHLADYMELPQADKAYPTIKQAADMVTALPTTTPLDRRDRAMVALAFLGALRDELQLTNLQRKAMSVNLGHEKVSTTVSFGKMSDEERFLVMESIEDQAAPARLELSNEDKIALVDGVLEGPKRSA